MTTQREKGTPIGSSYVEKRLPWGEKSPPYGILLLFKVGWGGGGGRPPTPVSLLQPLCIDGSWKQKNIIASNTIDTQTITIKQTHIVYRPGYFTVHPPPRLQTHSIRGTLPQDFSFISPSSCLFVQSRYLIQVSHSEFFPIQNLQSIVNTIRGFFYLSQQPPPPTPCLAPLSLTASLCASEICSCSICMTTLSAHKLDFHKHIL